MTSVRGKTRNCRSHHLTTRRPSSLPARKQEVSREFTESIVTSRRPTSLYGHHVELAGQPRCHSYPNVDDFTSTFMISEVYVGNMVGIYKDL